MAQVAAPSTAREALALPLTLPCGVTIPNRIVKGAMTEQLAEKNHAPTPVLMALYERWGQGGLGVSLTGNVMVDHRALEGPRNVAVDDERDLGLLTEWATRAQAQGTPLWMQISHPGRQTPRGVSTEVVAPSAVPLKGMGPMFSPPRALTEPEIESIIQRFVTTAVIAQKAGFGGVQIHSAHGYLNSQFLSPLTNLRTDQWGGSLENRMRFLRSIVGLTRDAVGPSYPIAVKLNSADFQRGGFSEEESMEVVKALESEGVDLLEISGGNYENPMMVSTGEVPTHQRESTMRREAFFLDYAEKVRAITKMPLMLTGGLRTVETMGGIVRDGKVDCVGVARPLALNPDFAKDVIEGRIESATAPNLGTGIKLLDSMLQSLWHQAQMRRIADGQAPDPALSKYGTLAKGLWATFTG